MDSAPAGAGGKEGGGSSGQWAGAAQIEAIFVASKTIFFIFFNNIFYLLFFI